MRGEHENDTDGDPDGALAVPVDRSDRLVQVVKAGNRAAGLGIRAFHLHGSLVGVPTPLTK